MTIRAEGWRLREAGPGDAEALALAGSATFLETFAGVLPGTDIIAHCLREHSAERYRRWLGDAHSALWLVEAEQGGAPVGYAVLTRPDLPLAVGETDVEVKRIYLLGRYHGGGAGAALMEAAVAKARRDGMERLLLGVYKGNARAIAFYAKQGFQLVGERTFRVGGSDYEDVVLARPL